MVDEVPRAQPPKSRQLRLAWKARVVRGEGPESQHDRGSYIAHLPKEEVERLRWERGTKLDLTVEGNRIVLASAADVTTGLGIDQVRCGDVLEEMRKIPSGSVQMAITSPPYNVQAGYVEYTDDREYRAYREWLTEVWRETARVLCPGGRFALNIAPTSIAKYRPVHMDLSQDVESAGLQPRTEILWYKQNMTAKRTAWGSFRNPRHPHVIPSWEYVLLFHKDSWKLEGDRDRADISSEDFVAWSDGMWKIAPETARYANHPAIFPEELIHRLLLYFTYRENLVLDMFGGTGTVATVAKKLGRHYIHIDKSREYCDMALRRLDGRALPRGKRTKPSERSVVRQSRRNLPTEGPRLEGFEGAMAE
jgi:DNA modification methylase